MCWNLICITLRRTWELEEWLVGVIKYVLQRNQSLLSEIQVIMTFIIFTSYFQAFLIYLQNITSHIVGAFPGQLRRNCIRAEAADSVAKYCSPIYDSIPCPTQKIDFRRPSRYQINIRCRFFLQPPQNSHKTLISEENISMRKYLRVSFCSLACMYVQWNEVWSVVKSFHRSHSIPLEGHNSTRIGMNGHDAQDQWYYKYDGPCHFSWWTSI